MVLTKVVSITDLTSVYHGREWPRFDRLTTADGEYRIECFIDDQLKWFEGHFEQQAVLPGIAQIHWVGQLARTLYNAPDDAFNGMNNIKFHSPILPNTPVSIKLSYTPEKSQLRFTFYSHERLCSEGKLQFSGHGETS